MAREGQAAKGTHQILSHGPPENSTAGNASPRPGRMADGDWSGRPAAPTKHWAVKGELKEATGKKELKNENQEQAGPSESKEQSFTKDKKANAAKLPGELRSGTACGIELSEAMLQREQVGSEKGAAASRDNSSKVS